MFICTISIIKIKVIGNIYMIIKYKPTNKPITINRSTYKKIKEQIQNETDSVELQIENLYAALQNTIIYSDEAEYIIKDVLIPIIKTKKNFLEDNNVNSLSLEEKNYRRNLLRKIMNKYGIEEK
ncbi:hypothetical protein DWZ11_01110 [Megamonas rupellensis]|nr:hypothetical protein DWZ11_01110 [Megamonas rupellensis]